MFKKGDLVRCINIKNPVIDTVKMLIVGEIYLIEDSFGLSNDTVKINIEFGKFNIGYKYYLGGFHSYRFKKVYRKDLTEEEKFQYIKYKLGVRDECQKKR